MITFRARDARQQTRKTRHAVSVWIAAVILLGASKASAGTISLDVLITVKTRYSYYVGGVEALTPVTFAMNGSFTAGQSSYNRSAGTGTESARSWIDAQASSFTTTPFTGLLLSEAGGALLQESDQSFGRQDFTNYFDPNRQDYSDTRLDLTQASSYVEANRRFHYYRSLIISVANTVSSIDLVAGFDEDSLAEFVAQAMSGDKRYTFYYSESALWQDLTTYQWGPGFVYSSVDVRPATATPEPSAAVLALTGMIALGVFRKRLRRFPA